MHRRVQGLLGAIVAVYAITAAGCSYLYTVHLTGQILSGDDHVPVPGATVTIFRGGIDYAKATSDEDGRFQVNLTISNANLDFSRNDGERPLVQDPRSPYEIRITFDDQELIAPFPEVAFQKSNYDAYASVLATLDVTSRTVESDTASPTLQ